MQNFSYYFVQILVIRSKCQKSTYNPGGGKKFQEGQLPPTSCTYAKFKLFFSLET